MTELDNPFDKLGYNPEILDVAIQSLKRGKNGEGTPVNIAIIDGDKEEIIKLSADDRNNISQLIDGSTDDNSTRMIGFEVMKIALTRHGETQI